MPKGKPNRLIAPEKVAKAIEGTSKTLDAAMIAELNEKLAASEWEDEEPNKEIEFDEDEKQKRAERLLRDAGWEFDVAGSKLIIERPATSAKPARKTGKATSKPPVQRQARRPRATVPPDEGDEAGD